MRNFFPFCFMFLLFSFIGFSVSAEKLPRTQLGGSRVGGVLDPPSSGIGKGLIPRVEAVGDSITRDLRSQGKPYNLGKVTVTHHGTQKTVGKVDVSATVDRADRMAPNKRYYQDGDTYTNKDGRLPRSEGDDGYTEWVHPTSGIRDAGPQRIVRGMKTGSIYYTPDHYITFWRLR